MPQVKMEQNRGKKTQKLGSFLESDPRSDSTVFNDNRHASESSKSWKKQRFLLLKLKGLGCKWATCSSPAVIRTAGEWEARNKNQKKKKCLKIRRNGAANMCCTPPGIGIASDFASMTRNPAPRLKNRREARRNRDGSAPPSFPSRTDHRSAEELLEMLMSRQTLLPGLTQDRHHDWRLDVDDMSYEELLDLSDKIGYVGIGLQEEEITTCLTKFHHHSASFLIPDHKHSKCSICQEKWRRDDEIGSLRCGHHHHVECIKHWLMHKNTCPVCKSPAISV